MKNKDIWYLLIIFILIIALIIGFQQCRDSKNETKEATNLLNALSDTVKTYHDKDGNQVATIAMLTTSNISLFSGLHSKDSQIINLQTLVEKYKKDLKPGGSVTTVGVETNVNHGGQTTVISRDTIIGKDSLVYIYPEYRDTLKNKWINYSAKMNKDSSSFILKYRDSLSFVIGSLKGKPFIEATSYSPYSAIKTLRSYQVSLPKPKRFGIGPLVGAGVGSNLKLTPFIGIGISYNLIRF